jgi:hypothetical protein
MDALSRRVRALQTGEGQKPSRVEKVCDLGQISAERTLRVAIMWKARYNADSTLSDALGSDSQLGLAWQTIKHHAASVCCPRGSNSDAPVLDVQTPLQSSGPLGRSFCFPSKILTMMTLRGSDKQNGSALTLGRIRFCESRSG